MVTPKYTYSAHKNLTAYLYLLPIFLLMAVFVIYPIFNSILTSFKYDYKFLTGEFVCFGVQHYLQIAGDPVFHRAFFNTVFLVFVCVPLSMALSLAVAHWIFSIKKLQGFFSTLYYLPQVTNIIAAGMVFALIFDSDFGLINRILGWFGIDPVAWISGVGIAGSPALYEQAYARCLFVLLVYSLWQGLSLKVILFLGGLNSINPTYYQSARIDGTSSWNIFRKITLPLLSPTTIYVYVTASITASKSYSAVVALFGDQFGPPGDSSKMMITIVGYIIDSLGGYMTKGAVSLASAAAFILMTFIMLLTAIQLKATERSVYYK